MEFYFVWLKKLRFRNKFGMTLSFFIVMLNPVQHLRFNNDAIT